MGREFNLRTGIELTPDGQLTACKFGAFAHAMQAKMSGTPISTKNPGIDPFSVVSNPQSKLPFVIADIDFYLPRLCVPECIAQRLGRNPVDFIAQDRTEILRRALHRHQKDGGSLDLFQSRRVLLRFLLSLRLCRWSLPWTNAIPVQHPGLP